MCGLFAILLTSDVQVANSTREICPHGRCLSWMTDGAPNFHSGWQSTDVLPDYVDGAYVLPGRLTLPFIFRIRIRYSKKTLTYDVTASCVCTPYTGVWWSSAKCYPLQNIFKTPPPFFPCSLGKLALVLRFLCEWRSITQTRLKGKLHACIRCF